MPSSLGLCHLRPWAEVLKILCPTLSTQNFSAPSSPASGSPRPKTSRAFCSVLCQQDAPHAELVQLTLNGCMDAVCCSMWGNGTEAIGIVSSFSLLFRLQQWVTGHSTPYAFCLLLSWLFLASKLSCGHRTGKGQFSFQSQREAMPKNVQTTV